MDEAAKRTAADAVQAALHSPEVARVYASLGTPPIFSTVPEFQRFYENEIRQWTEFFDAHPNILTEQS